MDPNIVQIMTMIGVWVIVIMLLVAVIARRF